MTNKAVSDAAATGSPALTDEGHRKELRSRPSDTAIEKILRLLEYVNTEQIKNFDKEGLKNKALRNEEARDELMEDALPEILCMMQSSQNHKKPEDGFC